MQTARKYVPELDKLLKYMQQVPANDELELRVAVHNLQQYVTHASQTLQQGQSHHDILTACAKIIRQSDLLGHKEAPYIRSLHAFLYELLPEVIEPQSDLHLQGLKLHGCPLAHIEISNSKLQYIDFSSSNLSHADLHCSDISHSNMMSANLSHSNLYACCLYDSDLSWADLSHADFHQVQAINTNMTGIILDHTDASCVIFSGSNLNSAELSHANLSFSNLFASNLQGCKLYGTDLRGTGITEERLTQAHMKVQSDHTTLWGDKHDCGGRNPIAFTYYQ